MTAHFSIISPTADLDVDVIEAVAAEFFVILRPGDCLAIGVLPLLETLANSANDVDYIYGDEDYFDNEALAAGADVDADVDEHVAEPWPERAFYKPDFSPERLRSHNYCGPCVVVRTTLLRELIKAGASVAPDRRYDLVLRISERARRVLHLPAVLCHCHTSNAELTPLDDERQLAAVHAHLDRSLIDGVAESSTPPGTYRVRRNIEGQPKVSFIIPTRGSHGTVWGLDRCFVVDAVRSIIDTATYRNFELVVVYDTPTPADTLDSLRRIAGDRLVLVPFDRPFNFSEKINVGRIHASGELLMLFNDDMQVITPDFLEAMIPLAMEAHVGSVGAKLLLSDGRLQHGGHVYNGEPYHILWGRWRNDPGPFDLLAVQRECIGVTAACLMTRTDVFDSVGGFSTVFPIDFNDVDFALKLEVNGYRTVWTPFAELYHFETMTREKTSRPEAIAAMYARWAHRLVNDPYYNPNLAPHRFDWVELGLR